MGKENASRACGMDPSVSETLACTDSPQVWMRRASGPSASRIRASIIEPNDPEGSPDDRRRILRQLDRIGRVAARVAARVAGPPGARALLGRLARLRKSGRLREAPARPRAATGAALVATNRRRCARLWRSPRDRRVSRRSVAGLAPKLRTRRGERGLCRELRLDRDSRSARSRGGRENHLRTVAARPEYAVPATSPS